MSPNLQKIFKALAKELTIEVIRDVTQRLRESYVSDITSIVKACLNDNQLIQDATIGYITIKDLTLKYHISRQTVNNYVNNFGIERKKAGRRKLVNEKQFLDAMQHPMEKPKFLQKD